MNISLFFGVNKISWEQVEYIKNSAPEIIIWAIPAMFIFVLVEAFVSYKQDKKYYNKKETIGSLGLGIGNILISTWIKVVLFYLMIWIYNLVPWRMELNWWTLIPCYIIFDFCSYWAHRISHHQRLWWATHIAHHSGEHYNLSVSFRLSWVQYVKTIFFLPVGMLGFHPIIFFVSNQVAILFQFWVHTEYIRRLPWFIEYIFATPSNHRVHHGSQERYIDKNFGATLILWDRIFNTYQKEDEQAIYGLTTNIQHKANPLHINFHEFADMIKDVKCAKGVRTKLFFVFGSPSKIALYKKQH
ncbi:MAG TPA: sterol desaturase family protein [Cyclobacteriaceae bacterium]|nr:sterol desaturase family protein [Cyclobacteriaceae bacterium]